MAEVRKKLLLFEKKKSEIMYAEYMSKKEKHKDIEEQ